jgi:hypothetical protein
VATPTTTTPTAPALPVEPYPSVSPRYAGQWIEWEKDNLAKGKITPEEATRRFDALGATPEQRAPDTRSEYVKQLDAAFPPAKPEDYLIRYGDPGQEPTMTPELKQFDSTARTWLSEAQVPRELGNSLISAVARVAQQTKAMTPDQLEQYGYAEFAKLEKAHGPALQEKLQAVDRMVQEIEAKQPGLVRLLKSKGIFDNAMVANMLISHAQIYHARKGR